MPFAADEIAHKKPKFEIDEDCLEEEFSDLDRDNFGELASFYKHNARFLDKQYGTRREDDGRFMIGDSILTVDETSFISRNGRH